MNPRTVVRGGFGTSFNNGSYVTIARQLIAQPPFAVTSTSIGSLADPLPLSNAFADIDDSTTTNNFGVDKNYQLGVIKTWNVDVNHSLGRGWQVGGGYTGTQGTHLDVVRAPNRDPDGLRIEGVQPFLWQTSEGDSTLHAATVRLRKQQARGVAGSVSYTFAKSIDDASSIGGGGRVVAQNDQNLDAEWGLSSFDRRHQVAGNLFVEFPFGPNRRWLNGGGTWAALLRDWAVSMSFAVDSGTPFTARLLSATSDAARGTNGTLRADYTGAPISIDDPTLLRFFNTSAFAVPATNAFGSAGRNTIIGPGTQQVDASDLARRQAVRQSGRVDSVAGDQLVQHRQVWRDRFSRELADLRSGRHDPADADRSTRREVQVLMRRNTLGSRLLAFGLALAVASASPGAQQTPTAGLSNRRQPRRRRRRRSRSRRRGCPWPDGCRLRGARGRQVAAGHVVRRRRDRGDTAASGATS